MRCTKIHTILIEKVTPLEDRKLKYRSVAILAPVLGIGLFIVLYLISAYLYPGGSNADKTSVGYNWADNYWCDLLSHYAKNGELNDSRVVAMSAMVILCASLSLFWYYLPQFFHISRAGGAVIRYTGISSMVLALFIFTNYHDLVIYSSVVLGIIALLGTFRALYLKKEYKLVGGGIICLFLIGINNYIYTTGNYIDTLPIMQKAAFFAFLLWVVIVDVQI